MRLGASVPSKDPLAAADLVGADVVQIHLSAPRVWKAPIGRKDAEAIKASGRVVAAHAPYLCNPASGNPEVRQKTAINLQATLDEAARCGIDGVVVHAGHAAGGGDMDDALARWVEVARTLTSDVPLLIENTASGETAPGRHLDNIVRLFDVLRGEDLAVRIGSCFDTCHAWAGDPAAGEDPVGYVKAFAEAAGGIDLLHVNGSRDVAGAGRDRHTNLDLGEMPMDTARAMVTTAAEVGCPALVVETPSEDGGQQRDLELLATWLA